MNPIDNEQSLDRRIRSGLSARTHGYVYSSHQKCRHPYPACARPGGPHNPPQAESGYLSSRCLYQNGCRLSRISSPIAAPESVVRSGKFQSLRVSGRHNKESLKESAQMAPPGASGDGPLTPLVPGPA